MENAFVKINIKYKVKNIKYEVKYKVYKSYFSNIKNVHKPKRH